ncbi:hypothetical protein CFAEC_13845 (plasmid) [Corynebacterium faecale]|nr:hypothetical protein CFAEC_13845 [Corynebacterium faecale]
MQTITVHRLADLRVGGPHLEPWGPRVPHAAARDQQPGTH